MTSDTRYALEKLTNALECLATHPGDVRERLVSAHMCFHTLNVSDFPVECQADWRWIMSELTKFGPLYDHKGDIYKGSVQNTMARVRETTAEKIAKRIFQLYWTISDNQPYQ